MTQAAQVVVEDGQLAVRGELSFATATVSLRALQEGFAAHPELARLDLSAVSHCDSAGLACIIETAAMLDRADRKLELSQAPASMQALAEVADLPWLFHWKS